MTGPIVYGVLGTVAVFAHSWLVSTLALLGLIIYILVVDVAHQIDDDVDRYRRTGRR